MKECPHFSRSARSLKSSSYGIASASQKCLSAGQIRATRLEDVEFVEGFGFRDADVRALALAAPALRELVLESDVKFTNLDGSFAFLAAKCRKLEKLEASSCGITHRTVLTFAACCKGLTKPSFNSEPFLQRPRIHSLAALRGLESLELWDCPQVTGTALGSCQSLKRLLLENLPELRELSLAHLTSLRAILMLACYDCPQVIDTTVEKLLRSPTAPLR
jgi:hypothetical protein